jgi:hypothetical protein
VRPDPEYIKKLLGAFQDFPEPTMDIDDLEHCGLSYKTKEFYFHMKLFHDQGFIERDDDEPGLGIDTGAGDSIQWSSLPLRLTASGHAFAEALHTSAGWEAVKKSAVSASLGVMKDIAISAFKAELVKHGFMPH